MWELYLISRLGIIHGIATGFSILSILVAIGCYAMIFGYDWAGEPVLSDEGKIKVKRFANKLLWVFGFSLTFAVAIPNTTDIYLIYGVGSTIDYIQANPKATQLPDKCIDALNRWVDSLNDKEENK